MASLRVLNELKAARAKNITALQDMAAKAVVSPLDGTDVATYENLKSSIVDIDAKIVDITAFVQDEGSFIDVNAKAKNEGFLAFVRNGNTAGVSMQSVDGGSIVALDRGASSGGALVPTNLADSIWQKAIDENHILKLCTKMPITSDTDIPIAGEGVTWGWTAEKGSVTESDKGLEKVTLKAHKATGLAKVTWELVNDSKFDIENYLTQKAGDSLSTFLEGAYITGGKNETTKPCGIKASATEVLTDALAKVGYDDLVKLLMSPAQKYRNIGSFVASNKAIQNIMTLTDDSKRPIFTPSYAFGQPDILLGKPLFESANMLDTVDDILFGDFKSYVIGSRQGMVVQRLVELFAGTDQVGYLFHARTDGKLMDSKAISHLKLKTV